MKSLRYKVEGFVTKTGTITRTDKGERVIYESENIEVEFVENEDSYVFTFPNHAGSGTILTIFKPIP
ncbi:unnamed protein product [marine sediment metagenome]|uniref:Uncharacterized protein n=1 Tax=marine sediment metagenome TaxID=412755 RepID=X1MTW4_9ZZZZ